MCNHRCMCEIIGPGSLPVEDREKYYFPNGRQGIELDLVDKIREGLEKAKGIKTSNREVDSVH